MVILISFCLVKVNRPPLRPKSMIAKDFRPLLSESHPTTLLRERISDAHSYSLNCRYFVGRELRDSQNVVYNCVSRNRYSIPIASTGFEALRINLPGLHSFQSTP